MAAFATILHTCPLICRKVNYFLLQSVDIDYSHFTNWFVTLYINIAFPRITPLAAFRCTELLNAVIFRFKTNTFREKLLSSCLQNPGSNLNMNLRDFGRLSVNQTSTTCTRFAVVQKTISYSIKSSIN